MITYNNLCTYLIENFPNIKSKYLEEQKWYDEYLDKPHVFYGDLFNPYIISMLNSNNEVELMKIFNFLEVLSNEENSKIVNLVKATVLEYIGDDNNLLKKSYSYMGDKTRNLSDEVEISLGRMKN